MNIRIIIKIFNYFAPEWHKNNLKSSRISTQKIYSIHVLRLNLDYLNSFYLKIIYLYLNQFFLLCGYTRKKN